MNCDFMLCSTCHKWHKGKCVMNRIPPGYRICPNCHKIVEKIQNCNHIQCTCGKHFCYCCGFGPSDNQERIYEHMRNSKTCGSNAPDYRKYVLHEAVPDSEIERFYQLYPHLKEQYV